MKKYKNVLITGLTGQDGIFLTYNLLKEKNINIIGTSRKTSNSDFFNKLKYLKTSNNSLINLKIINLNLQNKEEIISFYKDFKPDYIYNLAGPSSVNGSFRNPEYTFNTIFNTYENLINAVNIAKIKTSYFQAGTSEMYGFKKNIIVSENSKTFATSPYGEAKLKIHKDLNLKRQNFEIVINNGILFNHESEFREAEFLFMKIITSAINIKAEKINSFSLGSLELERDWSYAGDIVKAIKVITENKLNQDFVIGSGKTTSIKQIVDLVFSFFNLDYKNYLIIDETLLRDKDPKIKASNPNKIWQQTGWKVTTSIEEMISKMIYYKTSL